MHELLLQASVPFHRHEQILHILAGLAAMQPQPVLELHHVFKPNRSPSSLSASRASQVGGAQDVEVSKAQLQMQAAMASGELYYLQVVEEMDAKPEVVAQTKGAEVMMDIDAKDESVQTSSMNESPRKYTLQFRDLPEPTRQRERTITSRMVSDTQILSGDPKAFMKAFDHSLSSTYFVEGNRMTQNSTSLFLYRVRVPQPKKVESSDKANLDRGSARLLDPSGSYILQATVRVQDGSKVDIMAKGATELLSLKETLKGVIDLEMADRLSLDPRIR